MRREQLFLFALLSFSSAGFSWKSQIASILLWHPVVTSFALSAPCPPTHGAETSVTSNALPSSSRIIQLPSGVKYFDAIVGDTNGPEAKEGSTVQFLWVLRKGNGYFVSSSKIESFSSDDEPLIYKVGNTDKVIKSLDEGIRGMKVNGVRRIIIPVNIAYIAGVENDKPGPVPHGFGPRRQIISTTARNNPSDNWIFEIKLIKVRGDSSSL